MKKILLLDNSKLLFNIIKTRINQESHYEIQLCQNLSQATEYLQTDDYFMLISSLALSDANKEEILEFIRKKGIATIVFSTSIESHLIHNSDYSNVLDYVNKDYNGAMHVCDLIDTISYAMGKKVLVVDDSNTSIMYIKKLLKKLLLQVDTAYNGIEPLEKLKNYSNYALIISDMNMPQMNGLEFIQAVRSDTQYQKLKIIITTAQTEVETKVKLYKYGADDVIYKPIITEELTHKVMKFLLEQKHITEIEQFHDVIDSYVISSSTDENGIITHVSNAFCAISGYTKEELLGQTHRILRHTDMSDAFYANLWQTIQKKQAWHGEIKNLNKANKPYYIDVVITPILDINSTILGYHALCQDITDKKHIERISITDALTNIYNRRYFNELFPKRINALNTGDEMLCFILMDIDHFKQYNDHYGHQAGDDALIKFAHCIKNTPCAYDKEATVFRLGGEEFGALFKSAHNTMAHAYAQTLLKAIYDMNIPHEHNSAAPYLTASMGLICIDADNKDSMSKLYNQADTLLYESKNSGRNRVTASF